MSLADESSLLFIPTGYKESKIYSVFPTTGVGDFTFNRNSSATRIAKNGLITSVATDIPRLEYPLIDGVVNGCPSLLLEPQSTNLQTYSSDLSSVYVPTNITQTSNYGVSPDGSLTSTRVVLANLTDSRNVETLTGTLTNGVVYTFSCYYKGVKGESTYMYFLSSTGGVSVSKEIIFTGDWQRESITFTAGSGSNYTYIVDARQGASTATDFEVWGAQVEAGSYPTSYIPTNGTAVTRLADTANGAGDASTFNDSEGVLMWEVSTLSQPPPQTSIAISDGSKTNRVTMFFDSTNRLRVRLTLSGADQVSFTPILTDITQLNKIAFKYKINDFSLFINGLEVATDTSGNTFSIGVLNTLGFNEGDGTDLFYGKTKQIQYFQTALTDSEIEELTSWESFTAMAYGQTYTIE